MKASRASLDRMLVPSNPSHRSQPRKSGRRSRKESGTALRACLMSIRGQRLHALGILAIQSLLIYPSAMSARDAILDEIKTAPESLVREAYDFILFLKRRRELESAGGKPLAATTPPDFLARQHALFGSRVFPDSQTILDELRADRY